MRRPKSRDYLLTPIPVQTPAGAVVSLEGGGVRHTPTGIEVVFADVPKPQIFQFPCQSERLRLMEAVAEAFFHLYRGSRRKSRDANLVSIRRWFRWLDEHDRERTIRTPGDCTEHNALLYLQYLKAQPHAAVSLKRAWHIFRRILLKMTDRSDGPPKDIHLPLNTFPMALSRTQPTAPLSVEEVARLLKLAQSRMESIWQRFLDEGEHWDGPTGADLTPFLLVTALYSGFNAATLMALRMRDVTRDGDRQFILRGEKPRAGKEQQATFDGDRSHSLSPATVVYRVIQLTEFLRWRKDGMVDRVWLSRSTARNRLGRTICIGDSVGYSTRYVGEFGRASGIEGLTLKRMRATTAEMVRLMDHGASVAAILGNSIDVAERHYKSHGAIRREQTALARQMEMRGRFVRTEGRRDIRDAAQGPMSAATPGMVCADPFNPPDELMQGEGMCAAYLSCPTCALAGIIKDSAVSAAEMINLKLALDQARGYLAPARWRHEYRDLLIAIEGWLVRFDATALRGAAGLRVAPLPAFE